MNIYMPVQYYVLYYQLIVVSINTIFKKNYLLRC